ncbi:Dihydroorotate dehydrogenase B (NAD(+)), electron transfer subunit (plasmid) [Pseudoseohaeicola sp. NH-UV-7]|uniref:ferredoxin reductase family protein n=1 Tax=Sulfitobacter sp. TBRI5 TaxID=2989732 RepID=UPI003A72FDDC
MKPFFLIGFYAISVTLPLILSWAVGGAPRPFRQELASGLGILAFSIILTEFVLSGRFKSISKGIGMDVTMRFHQMMARTALAFALLHPFLYAGSPAGGVRPWDSMRRMTLTTDFSDLVTGIAAFLLLPSLVLLAIARTQLDYKYETWRLMHGLGALVIALLLFHHTIYAGRYGSQPELVWLWGTMTAVAAGSLVYVYLIVPLRQRRLPWRVTSVVQMTPKQWELTLSPQGHAGMTYEPGQFVWLNVGNSTFSLKENPFSISSAPAEGPDMSFLIKELGDFTDTIGQIRPDTRAYLDGPYGNLSVSGRDEPGVALIAGGVGIAPLLGIIRQMRATGDPRQRKLIYANRTEQQIACQSDLNGEDVTYVLSEPPTGWAGETGYVDAGVLDRAFSEDAFKNWVFVLCGPKAMLDSVEDALIARGTPSSRILSERFEYD